MRAHKLTQAAAVVATLAITGCGSDTSDLDEALCTDLDTGMGLHQIRPGDMAPEEFAEHVNSAVTNTCPEYELDTSVSYFLENWGYR